MPRIVTVATHQAGWLHALHTGCARANLPLDLLGAGHKWTGFSMKRRLLTHYLLTCPPDTILFVTDAFDVLCLSSSAKHTFESFNADLVLSVDIKPPNPIVRYVHHKVFPSHNGTWLNAGAYAGRAAAIKELLHLIPPVQTDADDDQRALMLAYKNHPDFFSRAAIDTERKLFFNATRHDITHILDLIQKGNPPAFVHGPGNVDLTPIAQAARLPLTEHEHIGMINYFFRNKIYLQAKYVIPELAMIGLLILVLVFISQRRRPTAR